MIILQPFLIFSNFYLVYAWTVDSTKRSSSHVNDSICSNFDKNIKHNLVNVCEECHLKEHNGEIGIIGYKQTSKGIIIEIDKKARIYKLIKRGKHNWFMRKKINDKFKSVEENEIIEFYNKQVKSNIKEISVEMERDFFDISL